MRKLLSFLCAGLVLFGLASLTPGADAELKSGPQPGSDGKRNLIPGSFQTWMVTGARAGRYHSPVCEYGLNPVLLVFTRDIDEADKPINALLKKIDELIPKHPDARLGCCAVVLNDGGFRAALEEDDKDGEDFSKKLADTSKIKDELEARLKDLAKAVEFKHVVLALDATAGPKDYKLHPDAQITMLLCNKQAVLANYTFGKDAFTEKDAARIFKDVENAVLEVERLARPIGKTRTK